MREIKISHVTALAATVAKSIPNIDTMSTQDKDDTIALAKSVFDMVEDLVQNPD